MQKKEQYESGRLAPPLTPQAKRRFPAPQIRYRGKLEILAGSMNDYDRLGMPPVRVR